jgi:hypothetical protein
MPVATIYPVKRDITSVTVIGTFRSRPTCLTIWVVATTTIEHLRPIVRTVCPATAKVPWIGRLMTRVVLTAIVAIARIMGSISRDTVVVTTVVQIRITFLNLANETLAVDATVPLRMIPLSDPLARVPTAATVELITLPQPRKAEPVTPTMGTRWKFRNRMVDAIVATVVARMTILNF